MSAYTKQSKRPKPAKPQELIDRFKRDMAEAGFDVFPIYNLGSPYMPNVTIEIWQRRNTEGKEAQP